MKVEMNNVSPASRMLHNVLSPKPCGPILETYVGRFRVSISQRFDVFDEKSHSNG